jgi:hypothetical protein
LVGGLHRFAFFEFTCEVPSLIIIDQLFSQWKNVFLFYMMNCLSWKPVYSRLVKIGLKLNLALSLLDVAHAH